MRVNAAVSAMANCASLRDIDIVYCGKEMQSMASRPSMSSLAVVWCYDHLNPHNFLLA